MKLDSNTRNGKLRNRGRYGYEPGQFDTPHSRSLAARSNLYVAGLAHKRVQIFDNDGTFKAQILNTEPAPMDHEEIYKLELDGKILGKLGRAGKLIKEFVTVDEMDCRTPNQLSAGELTNRCRNSPCGRSRQTEGARGRGDASATPHPRPCCGQCPSLTVPPHPV